MDRTPQQWAYSALVGMSLLMAGWLWSYVSVLRDDLHRLETSKADKVLDEQRAADRWTGSQQAEYRAYVDSRLTELNTRMEICRNELEAEINRLHPKVHQ